MHHVMNRGARRAPVFVDDETRSIFIGLLGTLPTRYRVGVHGYALMPNHFHLVLESSRGNLSEAMKHLTGQFSLRVNALHAWDGPMFRGRFKNRLVTDDAYLAHLLAYVHLNPVRAHLASSADGADWTSHDIYTGVSRCPEWFSTRRLPELFGSIAAYREYVHEVQVKRRAPPPSFAADELWRRGLHDGDREPPAEPRPSMERALATIERITQVDRADLRADSARVRSARWFAAHFLVRAGFAHPQVAVILGIRAPGAMSRIARRAREHADQEPLARWLEVAEGFTTEN
jgi:REP element-mobilizing transposase RayT